MSDDERRTLQFFVLDAIAGEAHRVVVTMPEVLVQAIVARLEREGYERKGVG